ncbi:hypothetical protein HKX48_008829 [Thoreauomyces humboldtii]|nr:hypothetical protein HKX48_008829 [Thoreauomyces humboldtii]
MSAAATTTLRPCSRLSSFARTNLLTSTTTASPHASLSSSCLLFRQSPPPSHVTSVRHYDRKRYLKEKKKLRAQQNQEDVTFPDAVAVFRKYCLGQDKVVSAHVQVPKHEEGQRPVRGEVSLPVQVSAEDNSVILVFAKGDQADEAKRLGAHIVGAEELIQDIMAEKVQFDKVLATKEMFPQVIKIARILGPKGLMPSPAKGTVSDDIPAMLNSLRATTKFEVDPDGYIHMEVGRTSWKDDDIFKNMRALLTTILSVRPSKTDAKKYIESINISAKYTAGLKLPLKPFKTA